jgi:hypothetical protein
MSSSRTRLVKIDPISEGGNTAEYIEIIEKLDDAGNVVDATKRILWDKTKEEVSSKLTSIQSDAQANIDNAQEYIAAQQKIIDDLEVDKGEIDKLGVGK